MPHALRATKRCLVEDLRLPATAAKGPLEAVAGSSGIVDAFLERRARHPLGQETIQGLTSRIVAYSLHSADYRGITWYQENHRVVWLLAAAFHRSGKRDDAYPYFISLDNEGRLLPKTEDVELLVAEQTKDLARHLLEQVPALTQQVLSNPGRLLGGVLGGRIKIRAIFEADDTPMLSVAISQKLQPGNLQLPADWLMIVAAAFFPDGDPQNLSFAWDMGGRPLREDEIAFCDFVPR